MNMRKTTILVLCGLILLLFTVQEIGASMAVELSVENMAINSAAIVSGRVINTESTWDEEGHKIFTRVYVRVQEDIKGAAGRDIIVVEQPGGEVGDIGMKVQGAALFKNGEEVLLFLQSSGTNFKVMGLSQGKFSVYSEEPLRQQKMAVRPPSGLTVKCPDGEIGPAKPVGPIEYSEFISNIKEILHRHKNLDSSGANHEQK